MAWSEQKQQERDMAGSGVPQELERVKQFRIKDRQDVESIERLVSLTGIAIEVVVDENSKEDKVTLVLSHNGYTQSYNGQTRYYLMSKNFHTKVFEHLRKQLISFAEKAKDYKLAEYLLYNNPFEKEVY